MDEAYLRSCVQYAGVLYHFFRFLDKPHQEHDFRPIVAETAASLVQPYQRRFERVGKKVTYLHNLVLRTEQEYGTGGVLDVERMISDVGLGVNADLVLKEHPDEGTHIGIKPAHIFLECLIPKRLTLAFFHADHELVNEPDKTLEGWFVHDYSFINKLAQRLKYRPKRHPKAFIHYFLADHDLPPKQLAKTKKHERMHCIQHLINGRLPTLQELEAILAEDNFRAYHELEKPAKESRFMAYDTIRRFVQDVRRGGCPLPKLAYVVSTLPAPQLRAALRNKKQRRWLLEIIKEELCG